MLKSRLTRPSLSRRVRTGVKNTAARVILFFLFRGFAALYRMDSRVKREVDTWKEGFILQMKASAKGPILSMQRTEKGLTRRKYVLEEDVSVCIQFKSIDAAFLVLTGQMSVAQAYAQHRFTLRGDIFETMSFVRCVDLVEAYLFPAVMTKRILKELPRKEVSSLAVYRYALLGF